MHDCLTQPTVEIFEETGNTTVFEVLSISLGRFDFSVKFGSTVCDRKKIIHETSNVHLHCLHWCSVAEGCVYRQRQEIEPHCFNDVVRTQRREPSSDSLRTRLRKDRRRRSDPKKILDRLSEVGNGVCVISHTGGIFSVLN